MTYKEMLKIIEKGVYEGTFQIRLEGELIPEGLSLTDTEISQHWYFQEGDVRYILHRRDCDKHECFSIECRPVTTNGPCS